MAQKEIDASTNRETDRDYLNIVEGHSIITKIQHNEPSPIDFDLPEPPEEPLQSDCCGTGCTPCVFDVYQEELEKWLKLKAMAPIERAEWRRLRTLQQKVVKKTALSLSQYKVFIIKKVQQVTRDTFLYTFSLPHDCMLGLQVGQHVLLR